MSDSEHSPQWVSGADLDRVLEELSLSRIGPETRMQCKVCWWVYDPAQGCPEWNIEPGTSFRDLPESFSCPDCGHGKSSFMPADDDAG